MLDPAEKATLVAETLNSKYKIAGKEHNLYSDIVPSGHKQEDLFYPTFEMALNVLENLREDSGTGPDMLPARILKMCAKQLARPIVLLVTRMLCDGVWPDMWREHWIVPIFKRGSVFKPANYRGIHMTAQLSKIVERLIKRMVEPYLEHSLALGVNQFAYRAQRGARDALAFLTLQWMCALNKRQNIVVYCSDVAGAFDRVSMERLIAKLYAKGVNEKLIRLFESWLQARRARVAIGGEFSSETPLKDMVFQGTVLGPLLWLIFFQDASRAIIEAFFQDIVFADDLNAYRIYEETTPNTTLWRHAEQCQTNLHKWGTANQVSFDANKESFNIISRYVPEGPGFKLLGIFYDNALSMTKTVTKLHDDAMWKVRTLLRSRRFYDVKEMVTSYKAKVLSYLEYRTAAIYHAATTLLQLVDKIQDRFLSEMGISELDALTDFHLSPLSARRDMGMLGLIHRTVIGYGPDHFKQFFVKENATRIRERHNTKRHDFRLSTYRTG